jgi:NADH:ubiquinone oxidoreductase subunit 5 (subunit L)/multisubunit Na+/H+ antiporter MnhA subunit
MGLILSAFGLTILLPEQRHEILAIVTFMALHHGLNKSALFLACGSSLTLSRIGRVLFILPAASLAALPLTSGFLAKNALKHEIHGTDAEFIIIVLAMTSAATAWLLWHAWTIARRTKPHNPSLQPSWVILVFTGLLVPWWWALDHGLAQPLDIHLIWASSWPLLLAAVAASAVTLSGWRAAGQIPEGDLVVLAERIASKLPHLIAQRDVRHRPHLHALDWLHRVQGLFEHHQRSIQLTGLAALALIGLLWVSLYF